MNNVFFKKLGLLFPKVSLPDISVSEYACL